MVQTNAREILIKNSEFTASIENSSNNVSGFRAGAQRSSSSASKHHSSFGRLSTNPKLKLIIPTSNIKQHTITVVDQPSPICTVPDGKDSKFTPMSSNGYDKNSKGDKGNKGEREIPIQYVRSHNKNTISHNADTRRHETRRKSRDKTSDSDLQILKCLHFIT